MSSMTAGQAVVESLRAEGVKYVFGIIGVSFLDIADAFNDVPDIKARPDSPVLAISGDGGFLFNSQELETAVREHLGTVTLIMNNNEWGSEKALQSNLFGRAIGSELTNPRFDKLAELYGARGFYVDSIDQLGDVLQEAFATKDRPSVIEVPVDPEDLSNLVRQG